MSPVKPDDWPAKMVPSTVRTTIRFELSPASITLSSSASVPNKPTKLSLKDSDVSCFCAT